jgi:hypothetical protein
VSGTVCTVFIFIFVHLGDVCIIIVEKEMKKPFMREKSTLWLTRSFVFQEKTSKQTSAKE